MTTEPEGDLAPAPPALPAEAQPAAPVGQEPAPAAPEPIPSAAWVPPDTFADRFSRGSTAAVRYSVAAFGFLSLVLWVLWLVPSIAVSTSDSYRLACAKVAVEPTFSNLVGGPIVCERVPTWYRVDTPQGDLFRVAAQGPHGAVLADVRVKDGAAVVLGYSFGD